ncbi:MAG: hypothetical protein CL798_07330 [Chromatiales bacterium]|nr:hypothetical protein [Chromatiales bacterium]
MLVQVRSLRVKCGFFRCAGISGDEAAPYAEFAKVFREFATSRWRKSALTLQQYVRELAPESCMVEVILPWLWRAVDLAAQVELGKTDEEWGEQSTADHARDAELDKALALSEIPSLTKNIAAAFQAQQSERKIRHNVRDALRQWQDEGLWGLVAYAPEVEVIQILGLTKQKPTMLFLPRGDITKM